MPWHYRLYSLVRSCGTEASTYIRAAVQKNTYALSGGARLFIRDILLRIHRRHPFIADLKHNIGF